MKHTKKITTILLVMFIITQLIGLVVINAYSVEKKELPYGMQPPEMEPEISLTTIIIAMAIAIFLIIILTKIKATLFLKLWFFVVVVIAIGLTLNILFFKIQYGSYIALAIALPFAFYKVFKQNLLIHNITELLIYPGIAAVFVPILSISTIVALLLLISFYDIYAVWKSGFMQKLAKFQINELKFFAGFFVPYVSKEVRLQLKKIKAQGKKGEAQLKNKKIKVNLAILGGGDVVFPIIMAGVVLTKIGLVPALFTSFGASIALFWLFVVAKKGKFYPAMPFIASGALFGFALGLLTLLL